MKKYIVRTPQTDRQMILVPEQSAGDFSAGTASIADATLTNVDLDTINRGSLQLDTGGAIVAVTGLYLLVATVAWVFGASASIIRDVGYAVNGTMVNSLQSDSTVLAPTDQFVGLVSLTRGDRVQPAIRQQSGAAANATVGLSLALVAS